MMNKNVIKIIAVIVIVFLLMLLQCAVSGKKRKRARLALMPVLSGLFCIGGLYLMVKLNLQIPENITERYGELTNIQILAANILLFVGFIVFKLIIRPVLSLIWKSKGLIEASSASFYKYDTEYSEWFVMPKWRNFRGFLFALLCGLALASAVFIAITWIFGPESEVWIGAYPCAALIVVGEIYNFINGMTKEEYEYSVFGEDSYSWKVSKFFKIKDIYEQILPGAILASHTGCEFANRETPVELIESLKESDAWTDRITAEYFEVNSLYKKADIDCVQATVDLMNRKNVIFFNPFYKDLDMYITLPVVNALLSGKKCVIVSGRKSNKEDIREWFSGMLANYSRIKSLWNVEYLSDEKPSCEVGILTFAQLYDNRVITANMEFFRETDFILLIEPSMIVNTGQIALNIIAQEMNSHDEKPVYCVCDRKMNGLVGTLSHLLHADITDVVAMPVPRCMYTSMAWDADGDFIRQRLFDKQTKFLGNGIELAAIAIKNQIPKVKWYSDTKVPLKDVKWIAGQYYTTICRYMNLPAQQKKLYEKIEFIPSMWTAARNKEEFIIAEDEFCNMFSTLRAYMSRGTNQTFINVLSESYLLRDYMRYNKQMFMSNPDVIPQIVADYAKTERNTLIKLILMMTFRPVSETEIVDEFRLVGIENTDACDILRDMMKKYSFTDESVFNIKTVKTEIDELTTVSTCCYSISESNFEEFFANSLKNAYFIIEDEKQNTEYIDAKLFNHVTQLILPGQYVVYDGKYYIVKLISPQSGCVLRRAADLYNDRYYYRQLRTYNFEEGRTLINSRKNGDIEITTERCSFSVDTSGYLEMTDNKDLRSARLIDLSADPQTVNFHRSYKNKDVLKIILPESSEAVRFTISMLISELFHSVFPEAWQYIAVLTSREPDHGGMLDKLLYRMQGSFDENAIYIVEDSDMDIGLIGAIDSNIMTFFEIITDYLSWHFEKIRESAAKDPLHEADDDDFVKWHKTEKRKGLFSRAVKRILSFFGLSGNEKHEKDKETDNTEAAEENIRTSEEAVDEDTESPFDTNEVPVEFTTASEADSAGNIVIENVIADNPANDGNSVQDEKTDGNEHKDSEDTYTPPGEEQIVLHTEGEDLFPVDGVPDTLDLLMPIKPSRYQKECFLKFGFDEIDAKLVIEDVYRFLVARGWSNSSLRKARKRVQMPQTISDANTENHCDFCGKPLSGVSYERLSDGRTRCNDCSMTAINQVSEYRQLFSKTEMLMESVYNITIHVAIAVRSTDAKTIARMSGCIFKPSTEVAARVLGFAQYKGGKYSLFIENGSPRLAAIDTTSHELTHIWQYINWNDAQVRAVYAMGGKSCTEIARDIVYEGMAVWSAVQLMYASGEAYYAQQMEAQYAARKDVYGAGFCMYREKYGLERSGDYPKQTPFSAFPPLEPSEVIAEVKKHCSQEECKC